MADYFTAHLTLDRPVSEVFDFVAHPENHSDFDASDTVGACVNPGRIPGVGHVFTMEMSYTGDDGTETQYRTDNLVTRFAEGKVIEWGVGPAGERPLGWRWRYEFEAEGSRDASTRVTLTYDWTDASEATRERFGIPAISRVGIEASLALLDFALVAAHGDTPRVEP